MNGSFIAGEVAGDAMAVDGAHIYWTTIGPSGSIGRANLDGTDVRQHFITGAGYTDGVAVDSKCVYWANGHVGGSGSIGRAKLDGSDVNQDFIAVPDLPGGVAVDGKHVYWVDWRFPGDSTIGRANLDGSGVDRNFITGAIGTSGLAVDGAHVYWNNGGAVGTIGRADLDGSDVNQRFIDSGFAPGVAVDSKHVYWTHPDSGSIGRANLDGSGVNQSLIIPGSPLWALAVDAGGPPNSIAATVSCSPAQIAGGKSSTCMARITDTTPKPSTPTGTVTFSTPGPGSFSGTPCRLSGSGATASCTARYNALAYGGYYPPSRETIIASYGGDRAHAAINAATTIVVLTAQPLITGPSQSASRWRAGDALPRYARAGVPVGTTFSFTLDRRARVRFIFVQTVSGRRVGGNCVTQTKANRHNPRCERTITVATLYHQGHEGRNHLRFEGRINRRKTLRPGPYTLQISAAADRRRSGTAFLHFTIVRR